MTQQLGIPSLQNSFDTKTYVHIYCSKMIFYEGMHMLATTVALFTEKCLPLTSLDVNLCCVTVRSSAVAVQQLSHIICQLVTRPPCFVPLGGTLQLLRRPAKAPARQIIVFHFSEPMNSKAHCLVFLYVKKLGLVSKQVDVIRAEITVS